MSEDNLPTVDCSDVITAEEPIIHLTENGVEGYEILCRLCANRSDHLIPIFSEEGITNDLADKINLYLPVKITKTDLLPLQCCFQCASTVLTWHELVVASVEADRRLREVQSEVEKQIAEQDVEPGPSQIEEDPIAIDRLNPPTDNAKEENVEQYGILDIEYISEPDDDLQECSYTCQICFCNLENRESYEIHKLAHKKVCQFCDRQFRRQCDLLRHSKYCSFKRNTELKEEVINIVEKVEELIIDEVKDENDENLVKSKRIRRKKNEIAAEHFCDVCSKGFTRKHDMIKHRASQHKNVPENTNPDSPRAIENKKNLELLKRCKVVSPDGKDYFKCEVCGKLIHLSYNFLRHQTIHTGVRPFFCHICGKNYRVSSTLTRHIKELHYRIKKFSCAICERKFAAKASLEEHKNIHTNDRPFSCDICGKSFKQKSCLHIHKLFHSDVFRFSCNVCGKKYRRARDLKVHNWIHTGHRPYSCQICGSMFRLSQDLKRHAKIHNKIHSDFVCSDCGATFSQQRSLKIHRKIHKDETVKTAT